MYGGLLPARTLSQGSDAASSEVIMSGDEKAPVTLHPDPLRPPTVQKISSSPIPKTLVSESDNVRALDAEFGTDELYENLEIPEESEGSAMTSSLSEDAIFWEKRCKKAAKMFLTCKKEKETLQKQLAKETALKATLEKNISSLFTTAQAEIARYKKQIAQLREELDQSSNTTWRLPSASTLPMHVVPSSNLPSREPMSKDIDLGRRSPCPLNGINENVQRNVPHPQNNIQLGPESSCNGPSNPAKRMKKRRRRGGGDRRKNHLFLANRELDSANKKQRIGPSLGEKDYDIERRREVDIRDDRSSAAGSDYPNNRREQSEHRRDSSLPHELKRDVPFEHYGRRDSTSENSMQKEPMVQHDINREPSREPPSYQHPSSSSSTPFSKQSASIVPSPKPSGDRPIKREQCSEPRERTASPKEKKWPSLERGGGDAVRVSHEPEDGEIHDVGGAGDGSRPGDRDNNSRGGGHERRENGKRERGDRRESVHSGNDRMYDRRDSMNGNGRDRPRRPEGRRRH
mmetsp:Transcript_33536/g.54345  ORF Transcript_33536/g.54345 Transcript_33536/m.54345 type:complete len:516 (+) Transcript_33536:85-1632(+)